MKRGISQVTGDMNLEPTAKKPTPNNTTSEVARGFSSSSLDSSLLAHSFYIKGIILFNEAHTPDFVYSTEKPEISYKEAIKNLEKAFEIAPENATYIADLAEAYYHYADRELRAESEFDDVVKYIKKAINLMPTKTEYHKDFVDMSFKCAQDWIEVDAFGEEAATAIKYLTEANGIVPFAGQTKEIYNATLAKAHSLCGNALSELEPEELTSQMKQEMLAHLTAASTLCPTNEIYAKALADALEEEVAQHEAPLELATLTSLEPASTTTSLEVVNLTPLELPTLAPLELTNLTSLEPASTTSSLALIEAGIAPLTSLATSLELNGVIADLGDYFDYV